MDIKFNKVCVVGAGHWGKNHIRTLYDLGNLGGVVECDQKVIDTIKALYPNTDYFTSLDDAIMAKFDGFTVATPAETHFDLARKIIESGHHVLVEKPITMNSADALFLHDLSIENKVNLMVGHVLLFHPAFQKIKDLIEDGTLGDLQYIYSNRLNLGTKNGEIHFALFFFGFLAFLFLLFQTIALSLHDREWQNVLFRAWLAARRAVLRYFHRFGQTGGAEYVGTRSRDAHVGDVELFQADIAVLGLLLVVVVLSRTRVC